MAALQFRQRRVRRWWITGITITVLALFSVVFVTASSADNASGCDFAATGTTESCSGPLAGSTFAGGDGNLLTNPTTFGTTDWQNVSGLSAGVDLPSGGGDNSFGQGTKEDNANVSVVSGSIPPQKSDLTRFYEASEFANGSNFLYLAWERTNSLGSANMDFEINQKTQPDLTTTGPKTLNRTAGDLLVTFDFTNGGGQPTLGLLRWVTSGSTSQCFSSNSLPCWGNHVTLNGTNSIGAVNNLDAVTDPIAPNAPRTLAPLTFGETAINLTAAGVFPPGTCEAFGSAFLKSRSSASFPAEVKDFVAPVPVNISNCGSIKIIKHTDPRGQNQVFSYTSNLPAEAPGTVNGVPQGGVACPGNSSAGVQADGSFCLNDNGNTSGDSAGNTVYNNALAAKTYTVTEGADPTGYEFESLSCTGGTTSISGKTATITLAPNDAVTCTYVNKKKLGAIKITKTSIKGNAPLAGATFSITKGGTPISGSPFTTDNNGIICVGSLAFGDYVVTETGAPSGYAIDDSTAHTVTVDNSATCADNPYGGESISFSDTPLTDISVNAHAETANATQSTITCTGTSDDGKTVLNDSSGALSDPANLSDTGLHPGTYTCTITIDP
jgi:Prealbumin-like fold domain